MKDLYPLCYFLDLEVYIWSDGYFFSQAKYAYDLSHFGLNNNKIAPTYLEANIRLTLSNGAPLYDATLYRLLVGSLVYLTITCLDIVHVVRIIS